MTNAEIIQNVINYIKEYAEKKDIRQRGIRELCHAKGINIAQKTIDNMYKRPSSTTISTLLKVWRAGSESERDIPHHWEHENGGRE